jgi:hypothetical protein
MAETPRESKIDPYLLIAQEGVLDLAELIHKASLAIEDDCLELPLTTASEVERKLTEINLGELLVVSSDDLEADASVGTVELYAEPENFQMFVKDMINKRNPGGEIPVEGAKSRSATIGLIFPYVGVDANGYDYIKDHHIVVSADTTDEPPSISSWLDVQILGRAADKSVITHNTRLMTPEQSLAFVVIAQAFYEQATNRKTS